MILLTAVCAVAQPAWAADMQAAGADPSVAKSEDEQSSADTRSDVQFFDSEIIITGARSILPATALPLTVDVLGGEDFDDQVLVSGSVIDAVSARMPSFSPTREKLSGSGESLRGRSPLFAINGVPQSTPIRDGSRDGYTIDPFFIDRVEVIYGSNALQGIGATGGVVNQVTVGAPSLDGWAIRTLNQATGQDGFDGRSLGGKTAGLAAFRSGAFDMTAGAAFERRGAFVDGEGRLIGVDGTQGEIQDSDSWSVFGRLGLQLTPSARIDLVANRFALEGNGNYVVAPGFPTGSSRGESEGKPPANRAELASLSFTDDALAGGNFSAQAFFSRTRDIFGGGIFATFQDPSIDPSGQLFEQSVNQSRKIGGKVSYERPVPGFDALLVTAGIDALVDRTAQTLDRTGREWVPQSEFRSIAPFVQGNLKLIGGKLRLAGGLRQENVALDVPDFTTLAFYGSRRVEGGRPKFNRLLLNGGIVVEPFDGLRAYASFAEGYTIADVGRILRGINRDNVRIDAFLDLEPVVSDNREIGVEWRRGPVKAAASYWTSDSDLGSLLRAGTDGIYSVLRQPIALKGLDLSLEWRTPLPGLSVGGAYAHVAGRTDNDQDGGLESDLDGANIAPDRLNLYAEVERGGLSARIAMRRYFKRTFDGIGFTVDGAANFEGYTLVDLLLGYRMGRNAVNLGIQNLADLDYLSYYSDTVGAGSDVRSFAGRGRTFTIGLTSDF